MDMLKGGEYLNNDELVDLIANNASRGMQFVESLGTSFAGTRKEGSQKVCNRLGGTVTTDPSSVLEGGVVLLMLCCTPWQTQRG